MRRRDARIAKMDRAHLSARPFAKGPNHRYAAMAGRNRKVGRFALELRARIRRNAHERRAEEGRLEPSQLIVVETFYFERQAERLGKRNDLVIVAPVRPEQRQDAHWFAAIVVHAQRGH